MNGLIKPQIDGHLISLARETGAQKSCRDACVYIGSGVEPLASFQVNMWK